MTCSDQMTVQVGARRLTKRVSTAKEECHEAGQSRSPAGAETAEEAFPEEATFTLMVEVRGCLSGEEGRMHPGQNDGV